MSPGIYVVSVLSIVLGIWLAVLVGAIVFNAPGGKRKQQEFFATYAAAVQRMVNTVTEWADPAQKAHDDCVERVRQGFRTTRKGC